MNKVIGITCAAAAIVCGCGKIGQSIVEEAAADSKYVSPEFVAAAPSGDAVYVTGATGARLLSIAMDGSAQRDWKVMHSAAKVPVNPTGLAAVNDGVWVTCGIVDGELQKYNVAGERTAAIAVGHSPCAPVISADGKIAYVMNRFKAEVSVVNLAQGKVVKTVKVLREPFAAALGEGGKLLFVANMLPYCAATDDVVSAAVSVINTETFEVKHVRLPNGSTGVRGLCASPDGKNVYATHTMGRYQLPTTQLERGWMNTAAMSVFCGSTGAYINTVLLDDVDRGACNPWGIAVTADGSKLVVCHAGTRELSVIDRKTLHERLDKAAKGLSASGIVKTAEDVPNDLAFLMQIRYRVLLGGDGPRGIALVGNKAVAALYFADALATVDVCDKNAKAALVRVAPEQDITKDRVRRGEMLYNDGSMCFQQWQSCASCHPDGRIDGLNWDLLNDGVGTPKQTKSELYSHLTPPTMVTGIRKDMHTCNRAGLIHIQFVTRPEEDVNCFDAYCQTMKPIPSPYLVNGKLSDKAKRGAKVYEKAQCAKCHPGDAKGPNGELLWTDCKKYDVGLAVGAEATYKRPYDTPTLTECWRTAPYLYDGRALTMEEVLTKFNEHDEHGETTKLTKEEISDLAEYVLSL